MIADTVNDLIDQFRQQILVRSQHKTDGGKRDHQNRDKRQEREVGNGRTKLAAQAIVKAFQRADKVRYRWNSLKPGGQAL